MARGWESKGVESQIEDARAKSDEIRRRPEDLEREAQRKGLEMSRKRVARELSTATSPLRRTALEHALKHLDAELAKLD